MRHNTALRLLVLGWMLGASPLASALTEPAAVAGGQADEAAAATRPYLGVLTAPVLPETAAQLMLPEGVGLSVRQIAAGSPAEAAGLQRFDVLHKLDDQLLVNPQQLRTLILARQPGQTVTLTLFRAGETLELPIELGGQAVVEDRSADAQLRRGPDDPRLAPAEADQALHLRREQLDQKVRDLRRRIERMDRELAQSTEVDDPQRQQLQAMIDQLRRQAAAGPDELAGPRQIRLAPGASTTHFVRMADREHVIEVRQQDDDRWLKVTDRDGNMLFEGPINTAEQRGHVPPQILAKVEKLRKRARVEIQLQRQDAAPNPEDPAAQPGDQHMFH